MLAKQEESLKLKNLKLTIKRLNAPEIIRDTQTVRGADTPKIIGEEKQCEKPKSQQNKITQLSTHKMITRGRKSMIESLMSETTIGAESGGVSAHKTRIVFESENKSQNSHKSEEFPIDATEGTKGFEDSESDKIFVTARSNAETSDNDIRLSDAKNPKYKKSVSTRTNSETLGFDFKQFLSSNGMVLFGCIAVLAVLLVLSIYNFKGSVQTRKFEL